MRPPDNLRIHLAGDVVGDFGQPLISPHLPSDVVLRCPLPTSATQPAGIAACTHGKSGELALAAVKRASPLSLSVRT